MCAGQRWKAKGVNSVVDRVYIRVLEAKPAEPLPMMGRVFQSRLGLFLRACSNGVGGSHMLNVDPR